MHLNICVHVQMTKLFALTCSLFSVALCDCEVLLRDYKGFFRTGVLCSNSGAPDVSGLESS